MATKTRGWTAHDLKRLPDDGNRYEVVARELFVTPAPSRDHQRVSGALFLRLFEFVRAHRLGWTYYAPGDVPFDDENSVQPDLFVIPRTEGGHSGSWSDEPRPTLVVEILSPTTARRDLGAKRALYESKAIPEYWIVDLDSRSIRVVRRGKPDFETRESLEWNPTGSTRLVIDVAELFRSALD